jgi:hypothetical protein
MYVRKVIAVLALAAALVGCSDGKSDSKTADHGTSSSPSTKPMSDYDQMMEYINSSDRNSRIDDAIKAVGPIVVKAILAGKLGEVRKFDALNEPLAKGYTGGGSVYVNNERWTAFATISWHNGTFNEKEDVPEFSLDAHDSAGAVWLTRQGFGTVLNTGEPVAANVSYMGPKEGDMQSVDYGNHHPAVAGVSDSFVNTYDDAVALDIKVLDTLRSNMAKLPKN